MFTKEFERYWKLCAASRHGGVSYPADVKRACALAYKAGQRSRQHEVETAEFNGAFSYRFKPGLFWRLEETINAFWPEFKDKVINELAKEKDDEQS